MSATGCQKAGCKSDEVVFGHTLCPGHLKAISDLEHMQPLVERLDRRRRDLRRTGAAWSKGLLVQHARPGDVVTPLQAARHVTRHRAKGDTAAAVALVVLFALAVSSVVAGLAGLRP